MKCSMWTDPVNEGIPPGTNIAGVLLNRQYANQHKAGTYVVKTVADTRADFMAIYRLLT